MLDVTTPRTPQAAPHGRVPMQPLSSDRLQFASANAWIRAALHCRFNIDPLFHAAGIDFGHRPTPTIARDKLVQLMQQCVVEAAPHSHFPLVVGDMFAFDHLPALETFLATSPSLRQASPALRWTSHLMPTMEMRLEEGPQVSALVVTIHVPTDSARVKGFFAEAALAGIHKVVRMVAGMGCGALHLELEHDPGPQRLACEQHFRLPLRINQPRSAVVFQSSLLDRRLPGGIPALHQRIQQMLEQQMPAPVQGLTATLESIFRAQPALLGQGIERMAARLELHPRTLQRRLQAEGQLFADIQARCRFELAVTSLKTGQQNIEELSDMLGFADRHSFTRAFRRWTGLAPTEFRRQHLPKS